MGKLYEDKRVRVNDFRLYDFPFFVIQYFLHFLSIFENEGMIT